MNYSTVNEDQENGRFAQAKTVHGLWIGPSLRLLELLTLASFLNAGFRFRLWVYEPPEGLPKHRNLVLEDASTLLAAERVFRYRRHSRFGHGQGSVAGFSDLFRYRLLWQEGGWWTDMDITLLELPQPRDGYWFRKHPRFPAVGNLMHCPPRSPLMERCLGDAERLLDAENTDWLLPIRILNRHIDHLGLQPSISANSNRDSWLAIRPLLLPDTSPIPKTWRCIHWNSTDWELAGVSSDTVLPGSTYARLLDQHGLTPRALAPAQRKRLMRRLSLSSYAVRLLRNRWKARVAAP